MELTVTVGIVSAGDNPSALRDAVDRARASAVLVHPDAEALVVERGSRRALPLDHTRIGAAGEPPEPLLADVRAALRG